MIFQRYKRNQTEKYDSSRNLHRVNKMKHGLVHIEKLGILLMSGNVIHARRHTFQSKFIHRSVGMLFKQNTVECGYILS